MELDWKKIGLGILVIALVGFRAVRSCDRIQRSNRQEELKSTSEAFREAENAAR